MKQQSATILCVPNINRKNFSTRGFTLIEIAVVMAIIGMLMLLIVPRLPSSDQDNLRISARTLTSTIRYVQERAATSRIGYYITINPGTGSIKLSELDSDGVAHEPSDPLLQKEPLRENITVTDVRIPRLGKIIDGQVQIDIGVSGVRDFVTIHLRSTEGQFWTVMLFPAGGKVKNYEGYHEDPP